MSPLDVFKSQAKSKLGYDPALYFAALVLGECIFHFYRFSFHLRFFLSELAMQWYRFRLYCLGFHFHNGRKS